MVPVSEYSEHPEVVIVVKTWQGPNEAIAGKRLEYLQKTLALLERNLIYPSYRWHIADDSGNMEYVQDVIALMGEREMSFSLSGANGDIGHNLNIALRSVFRDADFVLNWSDDIFLKAPIDIEPYVNLLRDELSIGYVVLRPSHPTLRLKQLQIGEDSWWEVEKGSPNKFLIGTSLNLMHKRAWDFYGPYPEGLRIDIMQEEMAWRYRRFQGGLKIVIPEELAEEGGRLDYGAASTWDWQLHSEQEKAAWYRYRSYSARLNHG